jgi:hypothetical protein
MGLKSWIQKAQSDLFAPSHPFTVRPSKFWERSKVPKNWHDGHGDYETYEVQRKPDFSEIEKAIAPDAVDVSISLITNRGSKAGWGRNTASDNKGTWIDT